ncbi:formate dehydrogenase subunit gamma [Loktanella sp. SALINAS62]|uniref:formate dehydrogenase subunit gamma n=1 Tax=Loktanella sp. SALINAS62 TaxID=2706124 RepID=UPI001B8C1C48|nr:formate dehydrogenase subunit gamma [Loktanella sp. SALINAS62]MBS1303732.1 formate dehydrogenase subunit gamma [Loktanella sp. SALINAS62]
MLKAFAALVLSVGLTGPAFAQYVDPAVTGAAQTDSATGAGSVPTMGDRATTGGAATLDDILRRQNGAPVDDSARRESTGFDSDIPASGVLGPSGVASDSDQWRALRYDRADVTSVNNGPAATTLIQDGGMTWLEARRGPLAFWGGVILLGSLALLAVFYIFRGKMRMDHPPTGRRVERFKAIERFGHWLLATSFIVLGVTGLLSLFGRKVFIPIFGHESFAAVASASKWVHDNISWAFMIALVMIFVMWVMNNIPDRTDLKWLARGGGMFGGGHPPAKKFNAGQKLIFWAVIVFGLTISLSGLSLLFPFQLNLFAKTFGIINDIGVLSWVGLSPLPTDLAPQEEMALAQIWHAAMALILTAIIFFHIYLGTVGMEGAFDAMGRGDVDEEWAHEHHNLWLEQVRQTQPEKISERRI